MAGMIFLPVVEEKRDWVNIQLDLRQDYEDRRLELERWYSDRMEEAYLAYWETGG